MGKNISFREYLERRQANDADVQDFLASSDASILEKRSWADLMWAFRDAGLSQPYIVKARRFHHEYSRALAKTLDRPA